MGSIASSVGRVATNAKNTTATRLVKYAGRNLSAPIKDTKNLGSAAYTFDNSSKGVPTNIVKDYPWTVSNVKDRTDIPYIILTEHRNTESAIIRMAKFYTSGAIGTVFNAAQDVAAKITSLAGNKIDQTSKGLLDVYSEIFPDNPTNNKYILPYFTKQYLELASSSWTQIDGIGEAIGDIGGGSANILKQFNLTKGLGSLVSAGTAAVQAGMAAGETALKFMYPLVGINDRPRVFAGHNSRSVTIQFPLYNTLNENDWIKNRDFIYIMHSQNLYIKRDYITGIPPCFYRVFVPGQYFSYASSMTNFSVENLGNVRTVYDGNTSGHGFIVPDAWQVTLTLEEMAMPSLNQFQAISTGEAQSKINVQPQTAQMAKNPARVKAEDKNK